MCKKLWESGFKINLKKCVFNAEKIEYFGFVVDKNGVHQTLEKTKAIVEAPQPQNVKQLQSFIGSVTYHDKFIKNRAILLQPLYELLKKGSKWEWTQQCARAFQKIKKELASPKVLTHYDPNKELILSCDASPYGLGAMISHTMEDGSEQPIAFASRSLSSAEMGYEQIHREAAAIIFGVNKFYVYLFNRQFTLKTDHRPLTMIFGPKKGIPLIAANRLQRWSLYLSAFQYKIQYVKSQDNAVADALSRLPLPEEKSKNKTKCERNININYIQESDFIKAEDIIREMKKDSNCGRVIRAIREGWPEKIKQVDQELQPFYNRRNELSMEGNCVFLGYRILIPEALRAPVLAELHSSHFGIVRMKEIARSFFWWPSLDKDIEEIARSCKQCLEGGRDPPRAQLTPWKWPEQPWVRIHVDFLGPVQGDMFFVIIDAHSKWPEIISMKKNITAEKTIRVLTNIFAQHGFPFQIVSDNGPTFTSAEFGCFIKNRGIKHTFTPPYHPASNGAAENMVGTFKDKIAKIVKSGTELEEAVAKFLLDYRTTPHSTTGVTPASLMYRRELRTPFSLLRPSIKRAVEESQKAQVRSGPKTKNRSFRLGEEIMVKDFRKHQPRWARASIVEQSSPVTFGVALANGGQAKRHINQMRRGHVSDKLDSREIETSAVNAPRRSARLARKDNTDVK